MHTQAIRFDWTTLLSGTLGVTATLFVVAYLAGWKAPPLATDRAAFFTLAALGFAMCTLSMGRTTTGLGWTHPLTITGVVLGALIVLLVVAMGVSWRPPFLSTDRAALLVIAGAALLKWGLGIFSRVVLKR